MRCDFMKSDFWCEDGISDSARIFSRRLGGVGECFGEGIMICTRRRLYDEAVAFSKYIIKEFGEGSLSVLLINGGMYHTTVVTVACSLVGGTLTLSMGETDDLEYDMIMASEPPTKAKYKSFLSFGELSAVILGELSTVENDINGFRKEKLCIRFLNGSDACDESYSEDAAVRIAGRFADAEGILPWDVCLSTLKPCSREGFFGGLLAPMLYAKKWIFCGDMDETFEAMKLSSPTRLICESVLADRIAAEMERLKCEPSAWHKGRGSHPVRLKWDKLFPKTRAALRRLKMIYVHQSFGGRLTEIVTLGSTLDQTEKALFRFGVLSSAFMVADNCALAGFRRYHDEEGFWRLPDGVLADMRDVECGGIGRLVFYGDGCTNERAGISNICGFSTSKGVFYVKK